MSRARRLPRHSRWTRIALTALPVAVGGAVAVLALLPSPLSDALHPGNGSPASAGASPHVMKVEPATSASPDQGSAATRAARGSSRTTPSGGGPAFSSAGSSGADRSGTGTSGSSASSSGSSASSSAPSSPSSSSPPTATPTHATPPTHPTPTHTNGHRRHPKPSPSPTAS